MLSCGLVSSLTDGLDDRGQVVPEAIPVSFLVQRYLLRILLSSSGVNV